MHGRLHAAEQTLRRAIALAEARLDPGAPVRGLAHQLLDYVLHESDRLDEAAAELVRARSLAAPVRHHGILTGVLRVLALVHLARGDTTAAGEAMEALVRPIARVPGPIAAVLARTRPDGVPLAFLETVRRCAGDGAAPAGLTDRERDVLVLLAGGHSNKALARTLGVSVSTVKTHLNHAFHMLGAHSRTHALARARDLGLLSGPPLA